MSEENSEASQYQPEGLNKLVQRTAVIDAPGQVRVEAIAPSYVSYAHYQNQRLVSARHGVRFASQILSEPEFGEYTLRVVLRCQGRDISEPSFVALGNSYDGDVSPISYKLDGEFLFEVREATPASFVFSILDGTEEIAYQEIPTEVFPPQLWSFADEGELGSAALLLSTFVRPRDPSLDGLLTKARELKGTYRDSKDRPFSPNTSGYQGNDEEVFAEVKALYEAVQSSGIHYSNPPGSEDWTHGQLIRTNEEILFAKAATCLDSTVLFASLLENINIRPIIALIPGHAFIGFWTTTGSGKSFSSMVAPAEEGVALMARDNPHLLFVETTTMCTSPNQKSFEAAVALASERILGSLTRAANAEQEIAQYEAKGFNLSDEDRNVLHKRQLEDWRLIDIRSARQAGYRPLAGRIKNSDGTSSVIEYEIKNAPVDLNIQVEVAKVGLGQDTSPPRVQYWKSQLLDLTFNNPLLNMKRRSSQLKLFVPKGRLGEIEDFLQQDKGELKLSPAILQDQDGTFTSASVRQDGVVPPELQSKLDGKFKSDRTLLYEGPQRAYAKDQETFLKASTNKVRSLSRAAKTSIDETGLNNLYMTFGSLRWKRNDGKGAEGEYTVSPLILLPVTLRAIDRGRMWAVSLDDSNDVATNETLALKLYQEWGISIPALTAPAEDAAGFDIPGLINAVQIAIDEAKQSSWIVQQNATIGTYDFSTFHMWKDLNDNWEQLSQAPLVKHLIETDGTAAYQDPNASDAEITEEELDKELAVVPVPTDGTQLRAVVRSLRGESFIIQGPPGTGKSQTITNLLARSLQEGKKVLFMSEKPAALQVVKNRLDDIRLGSFVLDLHSKNTSSDSIRGQLLAALDANPRVDKVGIEAEAFDFDVATKALSKYPERLHRVDDVHGESVYSVRDKLLKIEKVEPLKLSRASLSYFHGEALVRFMSYMRDIELVGQDSNIASKNPWSFSNAVEAPSTELRDTLKSKARAVVSSYKLLRQHDSALSLLDSLRDFSGLTQVAQLPDDLPSAVDLAAASQPDVKLKLRAHLELLQLLSMKLSGGQTANSNFGQIPMADLEAEHRVAREAKLFKKKKLDALAGKVQTFWSSKVTADSLGTVLQQVREMHDLARRIEESSLGLPGLGMVQASALFADGTAGARLTAGERMGQLGGAFDSPDSAIRGVLQLQGEDQKALISLCRGVLELFEALSADQDSVPLWLAGGGFGSRLADAVESWDQAWQDGQFLAVGRWGKTVGLVEDLKTSGQIDGYRQILSGEISFVDAPKSFEKARLSLLLEKLIDDHELTNFDSGAQAASIAKLTRSVEALRVYNRDTIASSVVKARSFDPTAIAGRAGALRAEINKQKGKISVRQLMKKYWDTITEITPCVAASPDSVARFLDVNLAKFDLVVFDEASQLRVANSIGALGRGKSAIIVGDSKQMPPTSFFAASSSDDEYDEDADLAQPDVESILTMAEYSKLPSVRLQWHYRSQDEALIHFSNVHYYDSNLASFPSPSKKVGEDRAVVLVPVEGAEYIRSSKKPGPKNADQPPVDSEAQGGDPDTPTTNTNAKEAQQVVDLILKLYAEHGPRLNLGVVTMNESQKRKIAELLDKAADDDLKKMLDPKQSNDHIFVRALEKVQGDERDIIIMSIGFASIPNPKDPDKRKLPLTFGPLTKPGSEKRLNVAITRARKRVYVFCSFDPEDMLLSETSSEGMKGLKEYLKFAKDLNGEGSIGNRSTFEEPDRHRINVASEIQTMGYRVTQNYGRSSFKVDIAVEDPNRPGQFILAILLDGPGWKSRPAANDRDVLPVGVLERNMGWNAVERIWMPVWIRDTEGEKQRIRTRLEELMSEASRAADNPPEVDLDELPDVGDLVSSVQVENSREELPTKALSVGVNVDDIEPFSELPIRAVTYGKDDLHKVHDSGVRDSIVSLTRVLTQIEGPVHPDRLVSFVAKCFGLSHVRSERAAEIVRVVPINTFQRDTEGFIFPEGKTVATFTSWKRKTSGDPRDLRLISLTELGNSMVDLCRRTHGLQQEELLRQTGLAFGHRTLSSVVRARTEKALEFALSRKLLVLNGDHYEPNES
ncbi:DUF4011 domain-containing protein [Aquiluna sp. Uisw_065]|uniref:DUF4011 domain-containing protein n=1 Tax=Aquiluna sp. Uisw_065 TaxID=3230967 RepID=UPI0039EA020E